MFIITMQNLVSNSFHVELWYGAAGRCPAALIYTHFSRPSCIIWAAALGGSWSNIMVMMVKVDSYNDKSSVCIPFRHYYYFTARGGIHHFSSKVMRFWQRFSTSLTRKTIINMQWLTVVVHRLVGRRPLSKINPSWLVQFWQSGQMLVVFLQWR